MPRGFHFGSALLAVVAVASCAARASAADAAPMNAPNVAASERVAERARQLFDEGVRLANEGRFDSARAVFRSAYELQPHPSVLYNIAQCEVRLGDTASALATLERFLETGAQEIQGEQRQAVQKQLDELRAALPAEAARGAPPAPAGEPASSSTIAPPELLVPLPAAPGAPEAQPRSLRPLVLGATGVALLGAATGLYLWNDARHSGWSQEHADLAATPGFREQLARSPELWQKAHASNQQLSSIHTVDAVSLLLASAGALAVGAGVWDWLASEGSREAAAVAPLRLQAGASAMLQWQGRW